MHILRISFLLLILSILLLSTAIFASAPVLWQTNGLPLRQGYHIEWQRAGWMDDDGNVCYVWSDTRYGDRDVFAQKFAPDGTPLWTPGGALVVHGPVRQEDPDVCSDGLGGFIFTWVDYRADTLGDVYAQRLDLNGDIMWDSLGIPICVIPYSEQKTLHTIPDGQNGAIVLWHDTRSGDEGDLFAQHILNTGMVDPAWTFNGKPVAKFSANQGGPGEQSVDTDGAGGIIVAWTDYRNSGNPDIYINRITIDGTLAWADTAGMPVCVNPTEQKGVKLVADGNGGVFLVWEDKRNYPSTRVDLYIQRVNQNGQALFSNNGIPLCVKNNTQELARINNDGQGGAIIIWEDYRNDIFNLISDIYAQRINGSGQIQWGTQDLAVCTAVENQYGVRLSSDGAGGAICAWTDDRNGTIPKSDIYAQRLLANGSVGWSSNGIVITDAQYYQTDPLVRTLDNGSAFIAWADYRLGSPGIYYQLLDVNGIAQLTLGGEEVVWGIDGDATHARLMKLTNTSNEKFLAIWQDKRYVYQGYFIYQQVFDETGEFTYPLNGKPVALDFSDLSVLEGGQELPELIADDDGGAIICWEDHRLANLSIPQVYAQRIDSYGNPQWDSAGIRVKPSDFDQLEPKICTDENGGAFLAWSGYDLSFALKAQAVRINGEGELLDTIKFTDLVMDEFVNGIFPDQNGGAIVYWRGGNFYYGFDVFASRIDANCDTLWLRTLCDAPDNQTFLKGIYTPDGYLVFVWGDKRTSVDFDLYAQKMTLNGEILWTQNGVLVNDEVNDQTPNDLIADSTGNIFVIWQDFRNNTCNNLYMQKLNGVDGSIMFQASGLPISVLSNGDRWGAKVLMDDYENLQICWEDYRSEAGADIYATYIDDNGTLLPGWSENGDVVSGFYNRQINPVIVDDYYNGVVSAWEDGRSSGKSEILNLYMQRWNENEPPAVAPFEDLLPNEFTVNQNYPNPFNPATVISFNLPRAGNVILTIYNTLGQEVIKLHDGYLQAGPHQLVWKGECENGDFAASGIYYYQLDFNGDAKVMKMLLLK